MKNINLFSWNAGWARLGAGIVVLLWSGAGYGFAPGREKDSGGVVARVSRPNAPALSLARTGAPGMVARSAMPLRGMPRYEPDAEQKRIITEAEKAGIRIERHARLGLPIAVRGPDLGKTGGYSRGQGLRVQAGGRIAPDAVAVVDNLSGVFGVQNAAAEFVARTPAPDKAGYYHTRLDQRYQGLRVVGGQLIAHFNERGEAYEVNGRYIPGINLEVVPRLSPDQALAAAQQYLLEAGHTPGEVIKTPELVIFANQTDPTLAYELMVGTEESEHMPPGRWRFWIDARQGDVLLGFNDLKTVTITGSILTGEGGGNVSLADCQQIGSRYVLACGARHWQVNNVAASGYPDANSYAFRTVSDWGTSDRTEMSAANNFNLVQRYYSEVHGRNSFSGSGGMAYANVHEGTDYVNAYWDSTDFHFGDGDGANANPLAILDICGHEFTHAVTEYSADLVYASESGALNESFSDIFGACVEFYFHADGRAQYPGKSAGAADWLCGEDCWLASTALRDIRNPANPATVGAGNQQPTRYHGTYWDWGGEVHQNDGVQNFFFYLLSEGGSGNNDGIAYQVTGIGLTNAARAAYRALTVYCTPYTDYIEARSAWRSAAADLNPAWTNNVNAAWDAVCQPAVLGPWGTEGAVQAGMALDAAGTVYAASRGGYLYAFNSDGSHRQVWRLPGESSTTPAIRPDGAIAATRANRLYLFNPNGATNWTWPAATDLEAWGHPAVGPDGTVYTLMINSTNYSLNVCAIRSNGTTACIWTIPDWAVTYSWQSPAVGNDGNIYVTAQVFLPPRAAIRYDGCLISFNPNGTTNHIWLAPGASNWMDGISYTPAFAADGSILMATALGKLYSFNPNGATNYVRDFPGMYFFGVSPAIAGDGTIYLGGYDDSASRNSRLLALNPAGATLHTWNFGSAYTVGAASQTAPTLAADGTIYCYTRPYSGYPGANLYACRPDGATNRVWDLSALDSYGWPVLGGNGEIYLGSATGIAVIAGTAGPLATNAPWPKTYHDNQNTGCYATPITNAPPTPPPPSPPPTPPSPGVPSAPAGVSVSDGTYLDRIIVTWSPSTGANEYEIWRAVRGSVAAQVGTALETTWSDYGVEAGQRYDYWVRAKNEYGVSDFGVADEGYCGGAAPTAPDGVSASDGTYGDRVRVVWNGYPNTVGYVVLRGTNDLVHQAAQIVTAGTTEYEDRNVTVGQKYYYWIQATNRVGASDMSGGDAGWALAVKSLSVQASDGLYSHCIYVRWDSAGSGAEYTVWRSRGATGTAEQVRLTQTCCYEDYQTESGVPYYYWIKVNTTDGVSWLSETDGGYWRLVAPTGVRASTGTCPLGIRVSWDSLSAATSYEIWRNAEHNVWTAQLIATTADSTYMDGNTAGLQPYYYWVKGKNDCCVGEAGGPGLGYAPLVARLGGSGGVPVVGDYDRDRRADPAVYRAQDGQWDVLVSGAGYRMESAVLGQTGDQAAPADYDGDGRSDPAVLRGDGSLWVLLSLNGYQAAGLTVWERGAAGGENNLCPVQSDFDGDGRADPAVYERQTGQWRVCLSGWGYAWVEFKFGGQGYEPVCGDYDGDRLADPAVYGEADGAWIVCPSRWGYAVVHALLGGPGRTAVPADYDGDGQWDPAVYAPADGKLEGLLSSAGYPAVTLQLEAGNYRLVPADYNGDGRAEPSLYDAAHGTWCFW